VKTTFLMCYHEHYHHYRDQFTATRGISFSIQPRKTMGLLFRGGCWPRTCPARWGTDKLDHYC